MHLISFLCCWWLLCLLPLLQVHSSTLQQVRLTGVELLLSPQEQVALTARHPEAAGCYRLLRREASGPSDEVRSCDSSTLLLLSTPLPNHNHTRVNLALERSTTSPPLSPSKPPLHVIRSAKLNYSATTNLKSLNQSSAADQTTLSDCIYSGGADGGGGSLQHSWAVMSTCDGLSGIILHKGKAYRLEELQPLPHQQQQSPGPHPLHEVQRSPLMVVFPLSSSVASTCASDTRNLAPVLNDSTEAAIGKKGKGSGVIGGHHIRTREARSYTVELAVFMDDSLVAYVQKRYPSANARRKTKEIVMTLLTVVNQLLSESSLEDAAVSLRVVRLKFLGRGEVDKAEGEAGHYLNNFCRWQTPKATKHGAPRWDHSLLLTGLNLHSESPHTKKTMGISFIGGMCVANHSCSVVEATKFICAYTIAHELGHSMNLVHDGDPPASACSASGNLMAVSINDAGHTWSSCSRDQLRSFLDTRGTCLTEKNSGGGGGGNSNADQVFPIGDLPGRTVNADQQCLYMYGKGWSHAAEQFPDMCAEIWCKRGLKLRSPGVSAIDGTSCETEKVCFQGRCEVLGAALSNGATRYDHAGRKKPKGKGKKKKRRRIRLMKKIMKQLMKARMRNKGKREERKKGSNVMAIPEERDEKKDDKERKKSEKKQAAKEYMTILKDLFEELKTSVKEEVRETSSVESNQREEALNPFWWLGGKARQEDQDHVEARDKPVRENIDQDRDKRQKKRRKMRRKQRIKGKKKHWRRRLLHVQNGPRRRRKTLPKIRKIESSTHIIIKERLNYVKGKGWKVNILKIKKPKKSSRNNIKTRKYTIICDQNQAKCRIAKRQLRNTVQIKGRYGKPSKPNEIHTGLGSITVPSL